MFEDQQKQIFTPEQIDNFVGLYHILNSVDKRLRAEGYKIKPGKISKPKSLLKK